LYHKVHCVVNGDLRVLAERQAAPTDPIDALIAVSAISRGASIATRNVRDFAGFGVTIIDPRDW
jgi:predicted nucleic acid-binding protein